MWPDPYWKTSFFVQCLSYALAHENIHADAGYTWIMPFHFYDNSVSTFAKQNAKEKVKVQDLQ